MTIGTSVQAIIGLQRFCPAQKHRARTSNKSLTAAPFVSATYSWSCVPGVAARSLTGVRHSRRRLSRRRDSRLRSVSRLRTGIPRHVVLFVEAVEHGHL